MEIVGLLVKVRKPGHPVRQTWHPLVSTCGYKWRTWCIRRITDTWWTLTAHHGRCCSHTEQSWKHMEINMCCFKMSCLVHIQCGRSFRTSSRISTYVMSQRTLNLNIIPFQCSWFSSSIKMMLFNLRVSLRLLHFHLSQLRNGWDFNPCWYYIFSLKISQWITTRS
jgi:hypothetical protein